MTVENLKAALPEYAKDLKLEPRLDHAQHRADRGTAVGHPAGQCRGNAKFSGAGRDWQ